MRFVAQGEGRYGAPTLLRTYGIPLFLALFALLTPSEWLIYVFVVAGQGHFLMSFLYQYRAGKMGKAYLALTLVLLILFAGYLLLFGEHAAWVFLLIALLFPFHFAYDEFTLYGEDRRIRELVSVALFTAVAFSATLLTAFPGVPESSVLFFASSALFFSHVVVQAVSRQGRTLQAERYIWYIGALASLLVLLGRPEQILSMIIVLHGFNWLVAFSWRVHGSPVAKKEFWRAFWWTHGFGLAGFLAFLHFSVPALKYFFMLLYYDFWAVAHVTLTALPWKRVGA